MNDTVDFRVGGKDTIQRSLISDVDLVENGPPATNELDSVHGDGGRVVEVVYNDDIVALLQQGKRRERADVARAAVGLMSVN